MNDQEEYSVPHLLARMKIYQLGISKNLLSQLPSRNARTKRITTCANGLSKRLCPI